VGGGGGRGKGHSESATWNSTGDFSRKTNSYLEQLITEQVALSSDFMPYSLFNFHFNFTQEFISFRVTRDFECQVSSDSGSRRLKAFGPVQGGSLKFRKFFRDGERRRSDVALKHLEAATPLDRYLDERRTKNLN